MFLKSNKNIVGITNTSKIQLLDYIYETGESYPTEAEGIELLCDGIIIKTYTNIIFRGNRYCDNYSKEKNIEEANRDLNKIFNGLKTHQQFIEI